MTTVIIVRKAQDNPDEFGIFILKPCQAQNTDLCHLVPSSQCGHCTLVRKCHTEDQRAVESEELGAFWREPEIAWTDDSRDLVMMAEDVMAGTDREGGYTSVGVQPEKT